MNDERLRAIYERILAESHGTGEDVTPEQLLALAEGRGNDADRLRTLDVVMRSEHSRRDFELLRTAAAAMHPRAAARGWLADARRGGNRARRRRCNDRDLADAYDRERDARRRALCHTGGAQ